MISEKTDWVVFPRSTPTGLLHQWRSQVGGHWCMSPPVGNNAPPLPSSERLNGLALITIHKDIHFKYRDVIDQYVMQQNRRLQFE